MLNLKFGFDLPSGFRVFSIHVRCYTEVTSTCGALLMTRHRKSRPEVARIKYEQTLPGMVKIV